MVKNQHFLCALFDERICAVPEFVGMFDSLRIPKGYFPKPPTHILNTSRYQHARNLLTPWLTRVEFENLADLRSLVIDLLTDHVHPENQTSHNKQLSIWLPYARERLGTNPIDCLNAPTQYIAAPTLEFLIENQYIKDPKKIWTFLKEFSPNYRPFVKKHPDIARSLLSEITLKLLYEPQFLYDFIKDFHPNTFDLSPFLTNQYALVYLHELDPQDITHLWAIQQIIPICVTNEQSEQLNELAHKYASAHTRLALYQALVNNNTSK